MTTPTPSPEERAEKILRWLWDRRYSPAIGFSELCAAQIREACDLFGKEVMATHACYPEGFRAAQQKAEEILDNSESFEGRALADRIRQLKP